jgi:hypothetical protein
MKIGRPVIGFLLAGVLVLTLWTGKDVGSTFDEPAYQQAGKIYIQWFYFLHHAGITRALSSDALSKFWRPCNEWDAPLSSHPPLVPFLIGLSSHFFGGSLMASRAVTACFFTLLLGAVYGFIKGRYGTRAGLFAAASLLFMPRIFGDAHIAALDIPMAAMAFLCAVCFVKGMENKKWSLIYGVCLGLALLTKLNAIFLPVPLLAWGLFYNWRGILPNLLATIIGPLVFCGLWPWMWFDTFNHISQYFSWLLEYHAIGVYYFGQTYFQPPAPWHYPFVMTALTVPATILAAAAVGMVSVNFERNRKLGALLILSLAVPLAISALPMAFKYDGVRLFLLAFPFLACLAGAGFKFICGLIPRGWEMRRLPHRLAAAGIALVLLAPAIIDTVKYHPYYLSYYNEFAGGLKGASAMGMEETYWGDALNNDVYSYLVKNAKRGPAGSKILVNCWGMGNMAGARDDSAGEDPSCKDIILTWGIGQMKIGEDKWQLPDYVVLYCRKGAFSEFEWGVYRNGINKYYSRVRTFDCDGVPLVIIFQRKDDISRTAVPATPAQNSP